MIEAQRGWLVGAMVLVAACTEVPGGPSSVDAPASSRPPGRTTGTKDEAPSTTGTAPSPTAAIAADAGEPPPDPGPAKLKVADWEALFRGVWNEEWTSTYQALCKSRDSWDFYNGTYYLDGLAQIARATGKQEYVERAIACVDGMIASARPSRDLGKEAVNDDYLGWTSFKNGSTGQEEQLYEAYMWRHVAELLGVIRDNPDLLARNAAAYARILAFTEKNVLEKWWTRGNPEGTYVYAIVTHMASHWAWICLELGRASKDATTVSRCKTVVANIDQGGVPGVPANTGLRGQLVPSPVDPDAYFFDMWWGKKARPGSDVSHGNAVVAYLVEAQERGSIWTRADMKKLVATLKLVWPTTGGCAEFVDGSGKDNCWFSDGWDRLGRYDGTIQSRLETHAVGRGAQLFGTGALNALRLGLR